MEMERRFGLILKDVDEKLLKNITIVSFSSFPFGLPDSFAVVQCQPPTTAT